jgi:chromosome segregation ATPase
MTGMNNLALMLDEVLQQMQQQMANAKPGSQMCQKPGQGQPSPSDQMKNMGNLQQQLNSQLQQLKDGQKPGQRNPMGAKQFAQMAAKQSAIRKALEELGQEMNGTTGEQGELAKELKEIADQMEGTEEDLVNKIFNNEMLMRQQEILTRLLEAEDALREREIDPQRKSNTAQEISRDLPPALEEYLKKRQAEVDLWKTVPADLKPYYRDLVKEYLEGLE